MDFLFAKLRGKNGAFCKVLSDKTIYVDIPTFANTHAYQDDMKLEDEHWFALEQFSDKDYAPGFVIDAFNAATWSQISRNEFEKVSYLVSVQNDGDYFIFQNVTTNAVYKRQNFLSLDDQPDIINKDHLVIIHETPDAYYQKPTDKLFFRRLSSITSIFPGINELYKEATDAEVDEALAMPILNVAADFTRDKVKTANRRRIKEAIDAYNHFTTQEKEALPAYFAKYCPGIYDTTNQKVNVNDEKTLTAFLNCLNQRYYTTEISKKKKLALSVDDA